jgi:hypothetical protein
MLPDSSAALDFRRLRKTVSPTFHVNTSWLGTNSYIFLKIDVSAFLNCQGNEGLEFGTSHIIIIIMFRKD